jgi:hypothetical protein
MPTYFEENNKPLQTDWDKRTAQKINGLLYDSANRTVPLTVSTVTSTRVETFSSVTCGTGGAYVALPIINANEVEILNDSGQTLTIRKVGTTATYALLDNTSGVFWVGSKASELEVTGTAALAYKLKIRSY